MHLGFVEEPGPRDLVMSDPSVQSLKRACSPPKLSKSSSPGLSPTNIASSPAVSTTNQVSLLSPCKDGELVGGGSKCAALSLLAKGSLDPGVESPTVSFPCSFKTSSIEERRGEADDCLKNCGGVDKSSAKSGSNFSTTYAEGMHGLSSSMPTLSILGGGDDLGE